MADRATLDRVVAKWYDIARLILALPNGHPRKRRLIRSQNRLGAWLANAQGLGEPR